MQHKEKKMADKKCEKRPMLGRLYFHRDFQRSNAGSSNMDESEDGASLRGQYRHPSADRLNMRDSKHEP